MASLVYLSGTSNSEGGTPSSSSSQSVIYLGLSPWKVPTHFQFDNAILAAVIKGRHEKPFLNWKINNDLSLLESLTGVAWRKPLQVGQLEVVVSEGSQLETYEPRASGSEDSDALYFGHSIGQGLLLQYLGPDAVRTGDGIAHTSVHDHNELETYKPLYGLAVAFLRNPKSGETDKVEIGRIGDGQQSLTVQSGLQHPFVALEPTIILIKTTPEFVRDQVHGYSSTHNSGPPFRTLFPEVIASYTQRKRGLSARG